VQAPAPGAEAPSAAETLLLQRYYTSKAREVATALRLPGKVYRACALLLARCFLDGGALAALDARVAMLACLYVAAKAEERYVSAETLAAAVGGAGGAAALLGAELAVLRAVSFALVTHHPARALNGFVAAAAERADAPQPQPGAVDDAGRAQLRADACARCDAAMAASDAALMHSPGALALAALRASAAGGPWHAAVEGVAAEALARAAGDDKLDVAQTAAAAAAAALAEAQAAPPPAEDDVRAADRAWKLWRAAAAAAVRAKAAARAPSPARAGASPAPSPKRRRSGPLEGEAASPAPSPRA
jgi:hypothetical protein